MKSVRRPINSPSHEITLGWHQLTLVNPMVTFLYCHHEAAICSIFLLKFFYSSYSIINLWQIIFFSQYFGLWLNTFKTSNIPFSLSCTMYFNQYKRRKNTGSLLHAVQGELQSCHPAGIRQICPCNWVHISSPRGLRWCSPRLRLESPAV